MGCFKASYLQERKSATDVAGMFSGASLAVFQTHSAALGSREILADIRAWYKWVIFYFVPYKLTP